MRRVTEVAYTYTIDLLTTYWNSNETLLLCTTTSTGVLYTVQYTRLGFVVSLCARGTAAHSVMPIFPSSNAVQRRPSDSNRHTHDAFNAVRRFWQRHTTHTRHYNCIEVLSQREI